MHLRGQTHKSTAVQEFEHDIEQFRRWILESPVVTLIHHTGDLEGELGVGVRKSCGQEAIQNVLPGLAYEISVELRNEIVALGYTLVLVDRGKHFVLFGPLALVRSGNAPGMELGAVQGSVNWEPSVGAKLLVESGEPEEAFDWPT